MLANSRPPLASHQPRIWSGLAAGLPWPPDLPFPAGEPPLGFDGLSYDQAVLYKAHGFPGDQAGAPLREQAVTALGEGERRLSKNEALTFAENLKGLILLAQQAGGG